MANSLRILNLNLGDGRAGSGIFATALSKKLIQLGHSVIQGCSSNSYTLLMAEKENIPAYLIDIQSLYEFEKAKRIAKYANEHEIQIINTHHSGERYLAIFAKLFFGCRAKVVITRHAVSGTVPFLGSLIYNIGADMNIAVSHVVYRSLQKDITFKKKVIYGGIETEKFKTPDFLLVEKLKKEVLKKSLNHPIIGMVADYDPGGKNTRGHGKGQAVLFEAVHRLSQKVFLLLVGPNPEHCEALLKLARSKGLSDDQMMAVPFQEDILPYYYLMDMHILPSFSESLGLVTLEAMAAGAPCIGTDIGGINEIIQHQKNGLLFKKGDSGDLADQISTLLDNPSIKKDLAKSGKETVEMKFNMDRVARETADLFYQLVENG
ncbi:MAG: glycosyltransferase family 4 protein [Nitrospiria bacterium]